MKTNNVLNITNIIKSNLTPKMMQEQLAKYHENDIALALNNLSKDERIKLYQVLDVHTLADILEYSDHISDYVQELSLRKKNDVLTYMEIQTVISILRQVSLKEQKELIAILNPEVRMELQLINSFDESEIGSIMSTNYISIQDSLTIKEAKQELIKQATLNDNISKIYVLDTFEVLYGVIDLKDLIVAKDDIALKDIMTCSFPYIYGHTKIDDCISQLKDYLLDSMPILDEDNKMIGVITANDLVAVIGDELQEDYVKLGGLSAIEDLKESTFLSVKKRLPWLLVLLVLGLGVSATVGIFESIVAQLPIIMAFQSLILDMSGNVGTQSLAVAIRVLMDFNVSNKQKVELIFKECRVGFSNGFILGVLSFTMIGLYLMVKGNSVYFAFAIALCLGISMILSMFISSLSGTIIPIIFQKIGIDPAVASGPLITTVNDLVAVVSYYGLSWLILINLLHLA